MQRTVLSEVKFEGIGLHTGLRAAITVHPSAPGTGIRFRRDGKMVPAHFLYVEHFPLCTFLRGASGGSVSTVEHFMAAVWSLGIDNLIVDMSGQEMPIMDGSALPFVRGLTSAGIQNQGHSRRKIRVAREIIYREGNSVCRFLPAESFSAGIGIDFDNSAIGRQRAEYDGSFEQFVSGFSMARTFCMQQDIDAMKSAGRALGGSLENAVVFDGDRVLNTGGLRIDREPARHKMLDVIGDLALLGADLLGRFEAEQPGHKMTNQLLRVALEEGALVDTSTGEPLQRAMHGLMAA